MSKLPKIVLVFDPNPDQEKVYTGSLEASGFLVRVVSNEKDFWYQVEHMIPDMITLNSSHVDVKTEAIIKKIRKTAVLRMIPFVSLEKKICFTVTSRASKLKIELEDYPVNSNKLLMLAKKLSKNMSIPDFKADSKELIHYDCEVQLKDISEVHVSFIAPAKVQDHVSLKMKSHFLESLGIINKNFETCSNGSSVGAKQFKNEIRFRGLAVDILGKLKEYLMRHREK